MVMQDGKVFEKSGVGISVVHGKMTPPMQAQMRSRGHKLVPPGEGESLPFSVVGVSCVTHPTNPHWLNTTCFCECRGTCPIKIVTSDLKFSSVSCWEEAGMSHHGSGHCCAVLKTNSTVRCWGAYWNSKFVGAPQ